MEFLAGGKIGELFASLAFASALVSLLSFIGAETQGPEEKSKWERLGLAAFGTHIFSVLGIIVTLFLLIYTHQYQYHYVWSHSSNELPVYYMISCFWEGQEGSFLLWCFWHSILGGILMRSKSEFRNWVLATIASVELILSSMILGVYVQVSGVWAFFIFLAAVPVLYFGYGLLKKNTENLAQNNFRLGSLLVGAVLLAILFRQQSGFYTLLSWKSIFGSFDGAVFLLFILAMIGYVVYYFCYIPEQIRSQKIEWGELLGGLSLISAASGLIFFEPDLWKLGSTPFISLQSVFPDNEVYLRDPDFVPSNGSGLNPLLQNYWMVIHPPTLFLGFASTVVPFGFVIAGLLKGKYREWIAEALPWTSFSVMILGVGIIMGGYWAYETLNFGGYWNWDPVENGSLVPWLCGVASLHGMLIYQRSKSYLRLAMCMIISTFLLVLYATFLTRSGILGDTSVHTFTDLGLSGQLLILVLVYLVAVLLILAIRWKDIPHKEEEGKVWSAEFMLFLGVLTFLFSGAEILLSTSLPVINKIFGTSLAPPAYIQLFYYQWNVWFGIAFGILSGIGQFLWWKLANKKSIADALFRPFVISMVLGAAVIILLIINKKSFAFEREFAEIINRAKELDLGTLQTISAYIRYSVIAIADELLLISGIFAVVANTDVLIQLIRRNKKGLKVMGGTVAHIGFGLMLLGMLSSSGYDEVISKNITPEELSAFPEKERVDNLPLMNGYERFIKDYKITYIGRREAQAPISSIRIIERNEAAFKIRFKDPSGDQFGIVLPLHMFVETDPKDSGIPPQEQEIDLTRVKNFLDENVERLKPSHINGRMLFGLKFESLKDTSDSFILYPEAEMNVDESGIIAHPSRKIFWDRDLYVHVSSVPQEGDNEPKFEYHDFKLRIGDEFRVGKNRLQLSRVADLSSNPELSRFQIAAAARILVFSGTDTLWADPIYLIDKDNKPGMIEASIERLNLDFAFVGVDPEKGIMNIQVQERTNPGSDYVVIKAISKPLINLLWLGTFVLTAGFLIAIYRRVGENKARRKT